MSTNSSWGTQSFVLEKLPTSVTGRRHHSIFHMRYRGINTNTQSDLYLNGVGKFEACLTPKSIAFQVGMSLNSVGTFDWNFTPRPWNVYCKKQMNVYVEKTVHFPKAIEIENLLVFIL